MPRLVTLLFLSLLASAVHASDRGILATLPPGIEAARIMSAVRQALLDRDWVIEQEDATTVVARFVEVPIRARIRIVLIVPNVVVYDDIAERMRVGPPSQAIQSVPITTVPPEWIDGLRHRIIAGLGIEELALPSWSAR